MTENGSATSRELGCPHPEERACSNGSAKSNERARVSKDEDATTWPSCFETHRSAAAAVGAVCAPICAAMLLSMRAGAPRILANEAYGHFGRTKPSEYQPTAVRNDRRLTFPVSGLFFTGNGATHTCRPD
jgi:hypothetical protein